MLRLRFALWARLLVEFGLSNGTSQVIGMASGLAYVRYMTVGNYALYGLAATSLSFTALAGDLGLNSSVTYFWRLARADGTPFASYLAAIRRVRIILFTVVATMAIPIFPLLGIRSGFALIDLSIALFLLLATAASTLSSGVDMQILRLLGHFRRSYVCDLVGQTMRVVVAGCMVAGIARTYWAGLLGGLACGAVTLIACRLSLRSNKVVAVPATSLKVSAVLGYVAPAAPLVLAFALQDTVILWLAARYGGKEVVASVFALSRLLALIGILNTFSISVIVPRLSAIKSHRRFAASGWLVKALMASVGAMILTLGVMEPRLFLWLIGPNYTHLNRELILVLASAALTLVATPTVLLNRAKGWVRLDPLLAAFQIVLLLLLVSVWDFSTAANVLTLSLVMNASLLCQALGISALGEHRPSLVRVTIR